MATGRIAIGIDVGGSGIKAAVVDVEAGRFRSERHPRPDAEPIDAGRRDRLDRPARQAARARRPASARRRRSASACPGVTIDGLLKTAANIDPAWVDFPRRRAAVARR